MNRPAFPIPEMVRLVGGFILSVSGKWLWFVTSVILAILLSAVGTWPRGGKDGETLYFYLLMSVVGTGCVHLIAACMHFAGEEMGRDGEMPLPFREMLRWWSLHYLRSLALVLAIAFAATALSELRRDSLGSGIGCAVLATACVIGRQRLRASSDRFQARAKAAGAALQERFPFPPPIDGESR